MEHHHMPLPRAPLPRRLRGIGVLAILFLAMLAAPMKAQEVVPSMGKEFWLGFMQNNQGPNTKSLDIFISSYTATSGVASLPSIGWSQNFTVAPGVTTTLTVPMTAMHLTSNVVENKGIFIETEDTVSVFAINFEQYTADGTVVYPIQSLGTEYRIFSYPGISGYTLNSELLIVATQDGTEFEITTTTATMGGQPVGTPFTVQLDAGQSYQLKAEAAQGDLTGTTIIGTEASGSCRPFAVFSGTVCTRVPDACTACDHLFTQNLPRAVWGTTYYGVPFSSQTAYSYRILADTDNTVVTRNGVDPVSLNAGQFIEVNGATQAICFQGNQPFGVAQYMEGASCSQTGDPALLILNAAEQKIDNVTFATVQSSVINSHYLNIVLDASDAGNVLLDGAPIPSGSFNSFTGCPTSVYAQVSLTQGSHTLSCPGGLIAYIYGTGGYESYAYSVGSYTPAPPINLDSVYCGLDANGNMTLTIPEPMFDPFWTTLSEPDDILHYGPVYTFTPTGSEVYVVTGMEFASGCEEQYIISVELDDPLDLTLSASSTQVCAYTEVQLSVAVDPPGTYTYSWSPAATLTGANTATPVATPTGETMYKVVVSTMTGCAISIDSILVQVEEGNILSYEALTEKDALCLGDSSQLDLRIEKIIARDDFALGTGPMWADIVNGTPSDICGSINGDALYFDGAGNRFAQTIGFDVSAGGSLRFALKVANGTAPCADAAFGQNVLLHYSINNGVSWVLMNTYFEYQYPDFVINNVAIPPAAQTANTMFRWSQPTNGGAGSSNWVLDDVAIGVIDASGFDIAWSPAGVMSDPNAPSPMSYPDASGWYAVELLDLLSLCPYQDSVHIEVGEPFSIDVPADTALCDLAGIQLYANPSSGTGHTWAWTPNDGSLSSLTSGTPLATPTQTTEYTVTVVTAQGCEATASTNIIVNQMLGLDITTDDDDLCLGGEAQLNAVINGSSSDLAYAWTPAGSLDDATIASPLATPVTTTNYILSVTDTVSGCILVDSILINVNLPYDVELTNDTMLCSVLGFQLNVTHNVPNGTISWTPAAYLDDASITNPTITWPNTAQYIVEITDAAGCSARDTVDITVAFSDLQFFADSSICAGDHMVIDAGFPGSTYEWSTGETTQTITVQDAGDYTVVMTDTAQCQTSFTTSVTVDPLPVLDLGDDPMLCHGQSHSLFGGNGNISYLWNTGATTQNISVNTTGNYWVEVMDANQCSNSDTTHVTFSPLPAIALSNTTVCISETLTLDAGNPGSTYLWSTGETTQTIQVSEVSGVYSVEVTTPFNCSGTDDATITFIEFPPLELGPDTSLCDTETITLVAGPAGPMYNWSTGSTQPSITLTSSHLAWVEVSNGYCVSTDTMNVVFDPLPVPMLMDRTECISETVTLDAGNPGSTYLWSTGATGSTIQVNEASGTYSVQITTPENCTISDEATVTFIEFPVVELGRDTALCDGQQISLNAGPDGTVYTWWNASLGQTLTLQESASVWVQVSNGYCVTRDSIDVTFNPLPQPIADRYVICMDEPPHRLVLDAENPECSYLWNTGSSERSIVVSDYGRYEVLITTPLDCWIEERIVVEEYCPPAMYLPAAFSPNSDGLNDLFGPIGHNLAKADLSIFDRWGELVFRGRNGDAFWDGTYGGSPAQDGVYVWVLTYRYIVDVEGSIGEEQEIMGHVTLVR